MFRCFTFQLQLCSSQVHHTCCDSPSPVPPLLLLLPSQHCGSPHSASDTFFGKDNGEKIGGIYMKVIYREYTDATFTTPATTSPPLGLLGERSVISWGFVACVCSQCLIITSLYWPRSGLEGGTRRYAESDSLEQSRPAVQHPASWRAL